ncbi:MAG TPA: hypothetical protein VLL07_06600 [Pontiella sp.]|nr:hypothetical protein [Pontiella sp.]
MKKIMFAAVLIGAMSASLPAVSDPAVIKVRDLDYNGLMVVNSDLSLRASFDVKEDDCFDEAVFDFYLLLIPREKERGGQFFHCRTVHRYLEKASGYTSGISLDKRIVECIEPRDSKYALVVTCGSIEAAVENSEKDRWWEDASLGQPVENVLKRFADAPVVREWESGR